MSAEFWAIIGVGVGITTIVGAMFTLLDMRISDLRKDLRDTAEYLSRQIVRSEERTNDRIDALERNFRADLRQIEARVEARLAGVETGLGSRIDGLDARLRVVEQGQARIIGAVEMMQTIVVATLRGEEVGAD